MSADAAADEVAETVERAKRSSSSATKKRRSRKRAADPPEPERKPEGESEWDVDLAPPPPSFDATRPDPEQNIRTFEGIAVKYRLGEDPDISVQIWRVHPRFYPDGVTKADGYLEETYQLIDNDYVKKKYGGGKYELRIHGPPRRPSDRSGGRPCYTRVTIDVPGPMKLEPTAQMREEMGMMGNVSQVGASSTSMPEAPSVASKALELVAGTFSEAATRDARRVEELERRVIERSGGDTALVQMIREMADAHSRTTIDAIRESSAREAASAEERVRSERETRAALERRLEGLEDQLRRGVSQDAGRFESLLGRAGDSHERVLQHTIDRHNEAMAAERTAHEQSVRAMRDAHDAEKKALHEQHKRDIEALEARWQSRMDRIDDNLKRVEDERRRDAAEADRRLREREDALRAQHDAEKRLIEATWASKLTTLESAQLVRIEGLEERISSLKMELERAQSQVAAQGDAYAQIDKARSLIDMAKDLNPSGGGGGAPEKRSLWDSITEDIPGTITAIGAMLNGGGAPPGFTPIQLVPNQQFGAMGAMGGMPGMAPGMAPGAMGPPAPHRGVMGAGAPPELDDILDEEDEIEEERQRARERDRRRAQQQHRAQQHPQPPQAPQPPPPAHHAAAPHQAQVAAESVVQLGPMEAHALNNFLTKALDNDEDPEDFAEQIREALPPNQLAALLAIGADALLRAIQLHRPQSDVLSPAGVRFARETFHYLQQGARAGR